MGFVRYTAASSMGGGEVSDIEGAKLMIDGVRREKASSEKKVRKGNWEKVPKNSLLLAHLLTYKTQD